MIEKENLKDIYPLSPMQEGMLFQALSEEDRSLYVEQTSYRVKGKIDLVAFEAAWNRLVERYDILRTLFVHKKSRRPLQVVLKKREIEFSVEDLTRVPQAALEKRVRKIREADRARGFDLTGDLLMRIKVLKLSPETSEVIWSHHHILMDGWCRGDLHAGRPEIRGGLSAP